MALTSAKRQPITHDQPGSDASSSPRTMPMLTVAHWLSIAAERAHAAERDNPDIQACSYFSLLGLTISLVLLHWYGASPFVLLAD
jgi:hypothetical protein